MQVKKSVFSPEILTKMALSYEMDLCSDHLSRHYEAFHFLNQEGPEIVVAYFHEFFSRLRFLPKALTTASTHKPVDSSVLLIRFQ